MLDKNIFIGIPEGSYLGLSKPHILKQYLKVVQRLDESFHVKKVKLVNNITNYNRTIDKITLAELYNVHSGWYEKYKELYRPMSRQSIEAGKIISPKNLALLLNKARKDQQSVQLLMMKNGIDIWIAPVAPDLAPFGIDSTGDFRMNSIWSYTGLPVITIPTGVNEKNLPYSIQIVGRFGEDEKLLQISKLIEKNLNILPLLNEWELN